MQIIKVHSPTKDSRRLNQGCVIWGSAQMNFMVSCACDPPQAGVHFWKLCAHADLSPALRVGATPERAWGLRIAFVEDCGRNSSPPTVYSGIPRLEPGAPGAECGRKRVLPGTGVVPPLERAARAGQGRRGRLPAPAVRPVRARGLRRPAKHYSAPRVSLGSGRWREPAAFWLPWPGLNPAGGGPGPSPVASRPPRAVFAGPPRAAPGSSRPGLAPIRHACRARALLQGWPTCVRPGSLRSPRSLSLPATLGCRLEEPAPRAEARGECPQLGCAWRRPGVRPDRRLRAPLLRGGGRGSACKEETHAAAQASPRAEVSGSGAPFGAPAGRGARCVQLCGARLPAGSGWEPRPEAAPVALCASGGRKALSWGAHAGPQKAPRNGPLEEKLKTWVEDGVLVPLTSWPTLRNLFA